MQRRSLMPPQRPSGGTFRTANREMRALKLIPGRIQPKLGKP